MHRRLPRPTYANVSATLALFVALGGTGYAATTIGTSQIANSAVTTAKIKNAAVTSPKLANNAVSSARIASNAVTGAKIASNAVSSSDIASNAVGTAEIDNAAVTTPKIAAGAVTASQLAPATLAALEGRTGPAGAAGAPGTAGPAGPAGAKGDTGAVGPSDTYTNFVASGSLPGPSPIVVDLNPLPAGTYLFQANAILTNTGVAAKDVTCRLNKAGGENIDTSTISLDATGGLDTQTVTLAGTAVLPATGPGAALLCPPGSDLDFADADIMATQVGALHSQ